MNSVYIEIFVGEVEPCVFITILNWSKIALTFILNLNFNYLLWLRQSQTVIWFIKAVILWWEHKHFFLNFASHGQFDPPAPILLGLNLLDWDTWKFVQMFYHVSQIKYGIPEYKIQQKSLTKNHLCSIIRLLFTPCIL